MSVSAETDEWVDEDLVRAAKLARGLIVWLEERASRTVREVLSQIREHFFEDGYSVTELKKALRRTSNSFITAFRAEVLGFTPWRFIRECRLVTAACLLRDTEMSVLEVALAVGYDSHAHFSNLFCKWCGFSPTAYRAHARDLLERGGPPPEEVFTWGRWLRLHHRELVAHDEVLEMILVLEMLASGDQEATRGFMSGCPGRVSVPSSRSTPRVTST